MGNFLSGEPARLIRSRGPGTADHFTIHFPTVCFPPFFSKGEVGHAV